MGCVGGEVVGESHLPKSAVDVRGILSRLPEVSRTSEGSEVLCNPARETSVELMGEGLKPVC